MKLRYNLHGHTYRCGHASKINDEEYVKCALDNDFIRYNFTDHVPVHPMFKWDKFMRMHDSSKEEYIESINNLKEKYKDKIIIQVGFEAEYDEVIEEYLCELKEKVDYLVLGQHYILGRDIKYQVDYPIIYAEKVCRAIESGLFDIVAHPDIFMRTNRCFNEEEENEFKKNVVLSSEIIGKKALEYNIPLELNLGGFYQDIEDGPLYPTALFWDKIIELGNKIVVSVDTHDPSDFNTINRKLDVINSFIPLSKLNILDDYDPVLERSHNDKLKSSLEKTKSNLESVEERVKKSLYLGKRLN